MQLIVSIINKCFIWFAIKLTIIRVCFNFWLFFFVFYFGCCLAIVLLLSNCRRTARWFFIITSIASNPCANTFPKSWLFPCLLSLVLHSRLQDIPLFPVHIPWLTLTTSDSFVYYNYFNKLQSIAILETNQIKLNLWNTSVPY